jgi:hypothetical protein
MFSLEEKLIILDSVVRRMVELNHEHPKIELFKTIQEKIINQIREV